MRKKNSMDFFSLLTILTTIAGISMASSNGLQALKIFRTKSAHDIAPSAFIILTIGAFIWIIYGFAIGDFPIVISNSLGFAFTLIVLLGYLIYGNKNRP